MATQIQIKRGSTTPAGLTVGESAMNTSTNQIYLGGTGGTVLVGGEVTGGVDMGAGSAVSANRIPTQSGVYNYVRNSTVTSFNGATGAVGGVTTSAANTFTALQSFSAGISAAGGVTFANAISVDSMKIGRGAGGVTSNVAIGDGLTQPVLSSNTTGYGNVGIGFDAIPYNTTGAENTAVGVGALEGNTTGSSNTGVGAYAAQNAYTTSNNTAVGAYSLISAQGSSNTAVGTNSLGSIVGDNNVALGNFAGKYRGTGTSSLTSGTGGIYIGHEARGSANATTNQIVIGTKALGLGSNTTVLGATTAVSATIYGLVNAPSGISAAGGTFSALTQFTSGLSGHINISETNATGSMYLLMARGTGVTAVFADTTTTPLVYQASAGNLGLKGITLVNGNDYLYITPTQITATNTVTPTASYFYFIAQGGNYFQSQTLSQIGDIGAVNSALALSIDPSTRVMTWGDGYDLTGVTSGFFGVNRSYAGMCADYAVEINSPTGKGLQLIYNDFIGAASNWVNMDVSSGGNYTLRPSGGLATVTGTLNVSAGISAAGGVTLAGTFSGTTAAFTGLVSSTVGFSGSGTNLKNIVTTFNGLSGAVTGASLGANTFTALNTFNAGISASTLTVSGGATFSGNVYLGDNATGVTATSNDFVRILAGTNPYGLWNGVAGIYQSRKNLSASTSGVICVTPEINFASYTTVELMVEYAETIAYSGGTAWASHKFLINVSSDEEYGGVSSSSYTESITKNGDVASIPFAISTSGASIQVTATVPANSGKIYNGWRFKTTMRVY